MFAGKLLPVRATRKNLGQDGKGFIFKCPGILIICNDIERSLSLMQFFFNSWQLYALQILAIHNSHQVTAPKRVFPDVIDQGGEDLEQISIQGPVLRCQDVVTQEMITNRSPTGEQRTTCVGQPAVL